jgi:TRAP-type C4-dicarboxylate transport system substrate-binding protein
MIPRCSKYVVLFVLVFSAFLLCAFVESTFAYSEKDPLVLKASSGTPPGTINSKTLARFCKLVEEKTNGRVKFRMFYSGSLVSHPKFFDGVVEGTSDVSTGPISFITNKVPELSIFEIYGSYDLSKNLETIKATEPILNKILEREGAINLFHDFAGPAVFGHKTKFLKSPEDWKGQKMRIAGRWGGTLAQKWGASSVFLGPGDMYLGLQRGIIDGYMLIWSFLYVGKLYEVAPFMTDTGFNSNYTIIPMNLKKWNTLTEADKKIFKEIIQEMNVYSDKAVREENENVRKDIIAKGGKIYDLTPAERRVYLKDCYALWPEVRKISGPLGNKLADILEEYRAR